MQITFNVSTPETKEGIRKLTAKAGGDLNELLKRAFALTQLLSEAQVEGTEIVFRSKSGKEEVLKNIWA